MRLRSNDMLSTRTALDLGAATFASQFGLQASVSQGLSPDMQGIAAACTVALAILAVVYGVGRTVERVLQRGDQDKSKLGRDDERFREIQDALTRILERLTGLEKDLIGRRANIDKEITVLTMSIAALERRAEVIELQTRKLEHRVIRLDQRVVPWLSVFEADGKRSLQKAYGMPPSEELEPITDDDSH